MPHSASTIETDGKVTMAQYTLSERESSQYETKKDGRPVTIRPMLAITKWLQTIETESPAKRCLLSYERSYRGQIRGSHWATISRHPEYLSILLDDGVLIIVGGLEQLLPQMSSKLTGYDPADAVEYVVGKVLETISRNEFPTNARYHASVRTKMVRCEVDATCALTAVVFSHSPSSPFEEPYTPFLADESGVRQTNDGSHPLFNKDELDLLRAYLSVDLLPFEMGLDSVASAGNTTVVASPDAPQQPSIGTTQAGVINPLNTIRHFTQPEDEEERRRREIRHAALHATLLEELRLVTGTLQIPRPLGAGPDAPHPNHGFMWDSRNLACASCLGRCGCCNVWCCEKLALWEANVDEGTPSVKRIEIDQRIGQIATLMPTPTDPITFMMCTQCHRFVCPNCCGVCPLMACSDRVCIECKNGNPWTLCDWH